MKKQNLFTRLRTILRVLFQFARQHSTCMEALTGTYIKRFDMVMPQFCITHTIEIQPAGHLFRVTQTTLTGGVHLSKNSWLAFYSWSGNGHLAEIGGQRFCFFDPIQRHLYLEHYPNGRDADVQTYERN